MRLTTERLVLTPFDADRDWPEFLSHLVLDPVVTEHWADFAEPTLTGAEKAALAADEFLPWFDEGSVAGILAWTMRSPAGEFVGMSGLMTAEPPVGGTDPEYGTLLATRWHGRGLATEAGLAVLDDGWDRLGLARVITVLDSPNPASRRLADKLGFVFDRAAFDEASKAFLVMVVERPADRGPGWSAGEPADP